MRWTMGVGNFEFKPKMGAMKMGEGKMEGKMGGGKMGSYKMGESGYSGKGEGKATKRGYAEGESKPTENPGPKSKDY